VLLTPIGVYNLSNTFAATLWSIDVVLNSALVGIDRFNFHGEPSGAYTTVVRALTDGLHQLLSPVWGQGFE
jgi:hypothetical protein